jgi:5'-phosphate synthase pdxT subunit
MKVGVLALQGAFHEHIRILHRLGVKGIEVRLPEDLTELRALIIPGGESTTIGKLAVIYRLMEPLRHFASDKPIWGICAGMIFMAKEVGMNQPILGLMDIVVERNAFGRQADSFEMMLDVPVLNNGDCKPFPAVFIRAPRLSAVKDPAKVIARLPDGTAVGAQQGKWLVTSFHPELTEDLRFHRYFLNLIHVADKNERSLPAS